MKTKMIKVNADTHAKFKALAKDEGMKFDALLNKIMRQSHKYEILKEGF